MICPACKGHANIGGCAVVEFTYDRPSTTVRFGSVMWCMNCAATTEVDGDGRCLDFSGLHVHALMDLEIALEVVRAGPAIQALHGRLDS